MHTDKMIRVRFAPSPTGPLHIGGVRTAIFNYLFARKHRGKFILRIEDTDQTRLVPGAEEYINETFQWLGLEIDEGVKQGGEYGPYKQSDRKDIYPQYVDQLLRSGWAYYAFDTPQELDTLRKECEARKMSFSYDINTRKTLLNSLVLDEGETKKRISNNEPFVVRFKMPENMDIRAIDIIRGEVHFDTSTLDDKVIFKSDGLPTYHLANIVDDHLMKITHVIRGEEWLPSLPMHVMLYKAFGWEQEMPEFAHLPLILKPDGKGKLSKRDGEKEGFPVFPLEWKSAEGEIISGFRETGYFPESLINMLALLGWNPGSEKEFFSIKELIESFSLERINKAGARFDPQKARWFNQAYMQNKPNQEIASVFSVELIRRGIHREIADIEKIIQLVKERIAFISDLWEQTAFFFEAPAGYDEKTKNKFWKEDSPEIMMQCMDILSETEPFITQITEEKIKAYIEKTGSGFGKVMNPLRLCIVGAAKGPHLFDILEIIGKEETIRRINAALKSM